MVLPAWSIDTVERFLVHFAIVFNRRGDGFQSFVVGNDVGAKVR
jgi:hypothetical protein